MKEGHPCAWVGPGIDICSACLTPVEQQLIALRDLNAAAVIVAERTLAKLLKADGATSDEVTVSYQVPIPWMVRGYGTRKEKHG
ncbi:MAG: hypothetical protein AB1705_13005 [Verrucomicrobiota bacterium]